MAQDSGFLNGINQHVAERESAPPEARAIEDGCAELTVEQILAWADAHYAATGRWPKVAPYPVAGSSPGDTWRNIDQALRTGFRGLPGGTSLARLLAQHRSVSNQRVDRSS